MSSTDSDPFNWLAPTDLESPHANQRRDSVAHVRTPNPDAPDELAIFEADEQTADGAWISAHGESFVALENAR